MDIMISLTKKKSVLVALFTVLMLLVGIVSAYAATVGDQLTSPEAGWQRIDDSDSKIIYTGFPESSISGAYQDTLRCASNVGDTIHFKYYGTKLRIIAPTYFNYTSEMKISIDSTNYTFSELTSYATSQTIVYEIQGLNLGIHDVVLTTQDYYVYYYFDAIDIDDNGYLVDINQTINLAATPGNALVNLSWNAVTGATGYKVYRSTTSGGTFTEFASPTTNSYTDSPLTNGTTYYYRVTAIVNGVESAPSNVVSATPNAIIPPTETGRALLVISMINGTEKEYDMSMTDVNDFISWYDGKATGTGSNYYIINKTFNKGPFQSRKDYIVFDKIQDFEVNQYDEVAQ